MPVHFWIHGGAYFLGAGSSASKNKPAPAPYKNLQVHTPCQTAAILGAIT